MGIRKIRSPYQEPPRMAITFKDFFPNPVEGEPLEPDYMYHAYLAAAQQATEWVEEKDVQVVNIETLTLPNFFHPQTKAKASGANLLPHAVFQFVRVWYYAS